MKRFESTNWNVFFLISNENRALKNSLNKIPHTIFWKKHSKVISEKNKKKVICLSSANVTIFITRFMKSNYCIYPKYSDTLILYHTSPKI